MMKEQESCRNFSFNQKHFRCKATREKIEDITACRSLLCKKYDPVMLDKRNKEKRIRKPWASNKKGK